MSENDAGGEFFAGFVIGGLVGAALALLMAPEPGEKMRAQLRGRGIELKSRTEEWSGEVRHRTDVPRSKVQELSAEARKKADAAREEARRRADIARAKAEELSTQAKKKAEVAREEARKQAELARKKAEELRGKGQVTLEEHKARLQEAIKEGKEAAAQTKDDLLADAESERATDA